jgi:hypothetical protein
MSSYPPGSDPPYPPMSARPGLIAKIAILSGPPARTALPRVDPRTPAVRAMRVVTAKRIYDG